MKTRIKSFFNSIKGDPSDGLIAFGGLSVGLGFFLIYLPLGFIVTGALLVFAGWVFAE